MDLRATVVPAWGIIVAFILVFAVVAFVSFASWIKRQSGLSTDDYTKSWDVFVKSLTALVAVMGGATALLQYMDQRTREVDQQAALAAQKTREVNVSLYKEYGDPQKQRVPLYHETVDVVATLATERDRKSENYRIARSRFERLFWGETAMMEEWRTNQDATDSKNPQSYVEDCMIDFRDLLRKTEAKQNPSEGDYDRLQQFCLDLAHRCQDDLDGVEAIGAHVDEDSDE